MKAPKAPKDQSAARGRYAKNAAKQNYAKFGAKSPAKPAGMSGDKPRARKGSPFQKK